MDPRLKPALVAMATIVVLIAIAHDAHAAAYRIVASMGDTVFARGIVHAAGMSEGRVVWDEIGQHPVAPRTDSPFFLEGRGLPALAMEVACAPQQQVALARGGASLVAFSMRGASAASMDSPAIEADGVGFLLRDAATGEPLAGNLRITRRMAPSPWQGAETGRITEELAEVAWAAIP